jgi:hypothetical protein
MADDILNDPSTVIDESRWGGGGACIDTSGDFMHVTDPAERRRYKERRRRWREKLRRAEAIRANWTPAQFEEEARQIAAQIEEWERNHAA